MNKKDELRKKMLKIRDSLSEREVQEKSKKIIETFLDMFGEMDRFLIYFSINNEVRTILMMDALFNSGKKVFLPKYIDGVFLPCLYTGSENLRVGKFGILEPVADVIEFDFDVIVVPGVVFGTDFNRIGMGKGYYDVMLKKVMGKKVGLAYQFQMVEGIDADSWDVKMDMIITEEKIYRR